ncbi:MAG: ATP-binding protein, partial [bacterium]|nr:ATP-binding protein [bacterium]
INVIPPLAGFVGSDLIAGIVTTSLHVQEAPALLIDFGTNSEIALWDGNRFFVTSAAGGPAFEGWGICTGMPAEAGAIYCAQPGDNEEWEVKTIANREPEGICGSGFVDIVSILLQNSLLSQTGKLAPKVRPGNGREQFTLPINAGKDIYITNKDVDLFQAAKAAIGVGIIGVCREAGIDSQELNRVCIGGAFGQYLDIENAQTIGLLPLIA